MPQMLTTNKGMYIRIVVLLVMFWLYFVLCNFKLQWKLDNVCVSIVLTF